MISPVDVITGGGFLLVLSIVLPVAGALLVFVAGGRQGERIVMALMPFSLATAIALMVAMRRSGAPLVYQLGGGLRHSASRCAQTACRSS